MTDKQNQERLQAMLNDIKARDDRHEALLENAAKWQHRAKVAWMIAFNSAVAFAIIVAYFTFFSSPANHAAVALVIGGAVEFSFALIVFLIVASIWDFVNERAEKI